MGGKSGGAPKPPNYKKLANQQYELDRKAAHENTVANRPNQFAPGGSITWDFDPATNKWVQKFNLTQQGQNNFDLAQSGVNRALTGLSTQGAWNPSQTPEFDPMAGEKTANALYHRTMDRAAPLQAQQRDALNTRLVQQGLQPGSEAYNRSMREFDRSMGDVNTQAGLDATLAGGDEARKMYASALAGQGQKYGQEVKNYAMPWDMAQNAQALQSGIYMPQFQNFGTASGYNAPNMMGAAQAKYNANMGNYNAGQNKQNSLLNAGANMGAAYLGGPAMAAKSVFDLAGPAGMFAF